MKWVSIVFVPDIYLYSALQGSGKLLSVFRLRLVTRAYLNTFYFLITEHNTSHPTEPQCSYDPVEGLTLARDTDPLEKIKDLEDQICKNSWSRVFSLLELSFFIFSSHVERPAILQAIGFISIPTVNHCNTCQSSGYRQHHFASGATQSDRLHVD